MTKHVAAIVAVFVAICSIPTLAGSLKDGPATVFVFGDDVEDEGFGFGYQAAFEFKQNFSIEFSGVWHEDKSRAIAREIPGLVSTPSIDLDVISLGLTGRIHGEPVPNLLVYGGAGLGYYIIEAENEDVREILSAAGLAFVEADGDKEFGAHFVVGTEVLLTQHWELFAEYRQVFLDSGFTIRSSANRDAPVEDRRQSFSYDHRMIRVGVNYRF